MKKIAIFLLIAMVAQSFCFTSAFAAGTGSVTVTMTTDKTSNLFFDAEQRIFNVSVKNTGTDELKICNIFKVTDYSGTNVLYTKKDAGYTLLSGAANSYQFNLDFARYGTYKLRLESVDALTNEILGEGVIDYCVARATDGAQNPVDFGVNLGKDTGYNDIIEKSGITYIRQGAVWSEYQTGANTFKTPDKTKAIFDSATKAGLDINLTVWGNNVALYPVETRESGDYYREPTTEESAVDSNQTVPISDEAQQGFVDFVIRFLDENKAYNITSVEVWNEPDLVKYNKFGHSEPDVYAKLMRKVYEAVKAKYPEIRIQGVCPSWLDDYMFDEPFLLKKGGWIYNVLYADTDGDGSADGYRWLDDVAVHHYKKHSEVDAETQITKLREMLDTLGKTDAKINRTEFGTTGSNGDFEAEALNVIQYYLTVLANKEVGEAAFLYTLVDDDSSGNYRYGLIEKGTAKSGYYGKVKPAYPMMTNANSILRRYDVADIVEDDASNTVYKFTRSYVDKSDYVYAFYSRTGSSSYAFTPDRDYVSVEFFDAYGNLLELSKQGSSYSLNLTAEPIYARVAESNGIEMNRGLDSDGFVSVDITIPGVSDGENVAVRVLDQNSKPVYIDQLAADADGRIIVNIGKAISEKSDYSLWIGAASFSGIYKTDLLGDDTVFFYLSKMGEAAADDISRLGPGEKLKLSLIQNNPLGRYVVVCAGYSDSVLTDARVVDESNMIYDGTEKSIILNYSDYEGCDKIKFYLFDSLNNITPLTTSIVVE